MQYFSAIFSVGSCQNFLLSVVEDRITMKLGFRGRASALAPPFFYFIKRGCVTENPRCFKSAKEKCQREATKGEKNFCVHPHVCVKVS